MKLPFRLQDWRDDELAAALAGLYNKPLDGLVLQAITLVKKEQALRLRTRKRLSIWQDLPRKDPMVGSAEKEPAMNKQIWYGANGGNVAFAQNKNALAEAGINHPQSFTVNGEVTGLNLIDGNVSDTDGQSSSTQTA